MQYFIHKTADFVVDSNPSKAEWQGGDELSIANWRWHDYAKYPTPEVSVKCLYSGSGIYVLFKVKENFIIAKSTKYQEAVWQDSCVEFFAAPTKKGYFNFEINCIGTLLLHWNTPEQKENLVPKEDIKIVSSLGSKAIEKAIPCPPEGYTVECFFPFLFFKKYSNIEQSQSGKSWKANFYKCGDKTPEPSWGAWAPVKQPKPSFHHPEYFGEIIFV